MRKAQVFEDGSVALVRDIPGARIEVHKDDVGHAVETLELKKTEFEALANRGPDKIKFDKAKKTFAFSEPANDTKGSKPKQN